MERMIVALSLVLAVGLSAGCNKGKDKFFGERTMQDGTITAQRVERRDGTKQFNVVWLKDGTVKLERVEFPNGAIQFDATQRPDGTYSTRRVALPSGEQDFDVTKRPDGIVKIARAEFRDGKKQFDVTLLLDGTRTVGSTGKPSHLGFKGLHAGQSQAEVEAALRKLDPNASLTCDEHEEDGSVFCDMFGKPVVKAVGFSRDGKLFHFMFETFSDSRRASDDFFAALRKDLADSNHEDGTLEPTEGGVIGDYLAKNDVQSFTWGTDRTVVCYLDQERDDCPSEEIDLTEYPTNGNPNATIEFKDNAYYSEGMVKKDKNRPKPTVAHAISFLGLYGGETRPQVEAGLRNLGYLPLACKYKADDLIVECSTSAAPHKIDLMDFVHGRLASFKFHYPASEHDELYQQFVKELGDPTDFLGRKGSESFTWNTESTVACPANADEQCPETGLIFTPSGERDGIVLFEYTTLVRTNIEERAQRMVGAARQ